MKPANAITLSRSSSHAGIGAPLREHNPLRLRFVPIPADGQPSVSAWLPDNGAAQYKNPPQHPKMPTGSFMFSPLARLLHLPWNPACGEFVPAVPDFFYTPRFSVFNVAPG